MYAPAFEAMTVHRRTDLDTADISITAFILPSFCVSEVSKHSLSV